MSPRQRGHLLPSASALLGRLLPVGAFTRAIEELVEKDNADNVIGWPVLPVPSWAQSFRPVLIADLGSGLGGETVSMLTRLGQWGCLDALREVHLFEHDLTLVDGTYDGLSRVLRDRVNVVLALFAKRSVAVEVHSESLKLIERKGECVLEPLTKLSDRIDLAFCSHITYFFDDGSGSRFTKALLRQHLAPGGRIWVNIRDLECPAYLARASALKALGVPEPQPFDYAEYYRDHVLPALPVVQVLDSTSVSPRLRLGADRRIAAEFMMWRTALDQSTVERYHPMQRAVEDVAAGDGPMFSETQFILAKGS